MAERQTTTIQRQFQPLLTERTGRVEKPDTLTDRTPSLEAQVFEAQQDLWNHSQPIETTATPPPSLETLMIRAQLAMVQEGQTCAEPAQQVGFQTREGDSVAFNTISQEGRELAFQVAQRILSEPDLAAHVDDFITQAENAYGQFRPIAQEIRTQLEVGLLFTQTATPEGSLVPDPADFLEVVGNHFATHQERLVKRNPKTGRLKLRAEGKRFSQVVTRWLDEQYPQMEFSLARDLITETNSLARTTAGRFLRKSLLGRLKWEENQTFFQVLEHQFPEELFRPQAYQETQAILAGAARFQYELSRAVAQAEARLGNKIDALQEIEAFEASLADENVELETEIIEAVAQPQSLRERLRVGWQEFKQEVQEKGFLRAAAPYAKKLAYGAITGLSIAIMLAPGVAAVAAEIKDLLPDSGPGQNSGGSQPSGRLGKTSKTSDSRTWAAAAEKRNQQIEARQAEEKETHTRVLPEPEPTPTLESGQVITLEVGSDYQQDLTVRDGDNSQPLDLYIFGQPKGESAVLDYQDGVINGLAPHAGILNGERLPGEQIDQNPSQTRLTIDGQTYRFIPHSRGSITIPQDVYRDADYPQFLGWLPRGFGDQPDQPAVVFSYCDGWDPESETFTQAKLWPGWLVRD